MGIAERERLRARGDVSRTRSPWRVHARARCLLPRSGRDRAEIGPRSRLQPPERRVHRRRVEQRLPALGQEREDVGEVISEPVVEQTVGLVDHEEAEPSDERRARGGTEVVRESARGAHNDMRPPLELEGLLHHVSAAHDDGDVDADGRTECGHLLGDLRRELARGREDHGEDAERVGRERLECGEPVWRLSASLRLSGCKDEVC